MCSFFGLFSVFVVVPAAYLKYSLNKSFLLYFARSVYFFSSRFFGECNNQQACNCQFLADRTDGRVYATVLRLLSVVCTECIVAKRCVLEQKLLLTAYRKSYMRNRLVPK